MSNRTIEDWQEGGFGIYIHWPFCQSKCPYCDFNSHVSSNVNQKRWEAAYLLEIDRAHKLTEGRTVQSVFFGGGTPSLMEPELVDAILARVRSSWSLANDVEITMEANPSSVEAGRFKAYRDAGVNRVSVGVQALRDQDLKALGRLHSVDEAKSAIKIAQKTFDKMSFDLIYARQAQSMESWKSELAEALSLASGHLSLYQLTIEQGTAFGDRFNRGLLRDLPNEDLGADMYLLTQDMTSAAGYNGYEVSNYAKDGHESRHNCIYWNAGDYLGIGPGAHGRLTLSGVRRSTEATSTPLAWLTSVERGGAPDDSLPLSREEQGIEYLMMGLRRDTGIDLSRLTRISGNDRPVSAISELVELDLLSLTENQLTATPSGRLVLNSIISKLIA